MNRNGPGKCIMDKKNPRLHTTRFDTIYALGYYKKLGVSITSVGEADYRKFSTILICFGPVFNTSYIGLN